MLLGGGESQAKILRDRIRTATCFYRFSFVKCTFLCHPFLRSFLQTGRQKIYCSCNLMKNDLGSWFSREDMTCQTNLTK